MLQGEKASKKKFPSSERARKGANQRDIFAPEGSDFAKISLRR